MLNRFSFSILIIVTIITGLNQGLLLPLLTIVQEQAGISSGLNGVSSAALYIGTFVSMFFIEGPVRRYGYKYMILFGLIMVGGASLLFPLWQNVWFWILLRIIVGIGDSALHYCTQLWVISASDPRRRGLNISLYGMFYAVGFSLGPFGINLLPYGLYVPFVTVSFLFIIAVIMMRYLPHERPDGMQQKASERQKVSKVYFLAWFALLPSILYGLMESSTNGNFPVYALRTGISEQWVSFILPAIGIGSLIFQLPLGMWSDKFGRKPVIMLSGMIGGLAFLSVPLAGANVALIMVMFAIAGGFVGSFYSLGLAYVADLLPKSMLPTANKIASIHFSLGSIVGPVIGGFGIQYIGTSSLFVLLGGSYMLFVVLGIWFRKNANANVTNPL